MVRHIVIDGTDGCGKTTQLNLLKKYLQSKGFDIHQTKGLGGDGSCDFQNAMRTVLLHNKFPKNNLIMEETLFSLSDLEGLKIAQEYLNLNPEGLVLKDRSSASHIAYAVARGMDFATALQVHNEFLQTEKQLGKNEGILTIIMVPTNVEATLNRIKKRQQELGQPITERLENMEVQTKVATEMKLFTKGRLGESVNAVLVEVAPEDTIEQIHNKIVSIVSANLA